MDTADITDTPKATTPTQNEQNSIPERSIPLLDEPQSPEMSHQGTESGINETVLQVDPNERVSDDSNRQETGIQSRQDERKSLPVEKVVTCAVAGVLSGFCIAMAYAGILSANVIARPVGPLAVSVILVVSDIILFSWISGKKYQMTTTGAVVPIFFSLIGGVMTILLFSVAEAWNRHMFIRVDWAAVLMSVGVFGGLGFGTTIGYLIFAKN